MTKPTDRSKKKVALITGVTGQDGSYLAEFLLSKNYTVVGLVRKTSNSEPNNVGHLQNKITLVYGDLIDNASLSHSIIKYQPDEVYNLAAQSYPGESWRLSIQTGLITGIGAHQVFEAVRQHKKEAKVYQASSSEMYGWVKEIPQNEGTPFNPANPYAAAKLYAHTMAGIYRHSYDMFIARGILFNHESPRRGIGFVSQKVTYGAACAKMGLKNSPLLNEEGEPILKNGKLSLGNLEGERDFGFAGDYVEAMWSMLQQDKPDDFVIGTGKSHTVGELCQEAFSFVDLDWKKFVTVDPRFVRPTETGPLVADGRKAKKVLGWNPKTSFKELVELMVTAHLNSLRRGRDIVGG